MSEVMNKIETQIKCECCKRSELVILLMGILDIQRRSIERLTTLAEKHVSYDHRDLSFVRSCLKAIDRKMGRHDKDSIREKPYQMRADSL